MAKNSNYKKLAAMRAEERATAARSNSSLLQGLTPTQIAELFPDYFRKGLPDVGGFRTAITKESQKQQALWQKGVNDRIGKQGGWLEKMRSGYPAGGGSGNYGSSVATGNLKQNQQEAYKAARAEGLSDKSARILVANLSGENLKDPSRVYHDPSSRNPNQHAHGIAAWEGSRAEKIKGQFGRYPQEMSVADQTKAAIWEMKKDYPAAYAAMTNENLSDYDRMYGVVHHFERPKDDMGSTADRMRRLNGFKPDATDSSTPSSDKDKRKEGTTPEVKGKGGSSGGGGATGDFGNKSDGSTKGGEKGQPKSTSFDISSGYIVPKDKNLYDPRNAQQCATLGKAFNPAIGRSNSWTVEKADFKAGQVVATMQYNRGGPDRTGSGYHTGVALTTPNEKGDFLLLEQYNGSGGAKTRWVNKNSFSTGKEGGTTSFGLIRSGGKLHDEVSEEALAYGSKIGSADQKQVIGSSGGTPESTPESFNNEGAPPLPPGTEEAANWQLDGTTNTPGGESQTASMLGPMGGTPNLMGMDPMSMMGGGGGTASPMGLVTTALGFIMPLIGSLGKEKMGIGEGEGVGSGGRRRRWRHGRHHGYRPAHRSHRHGGSRAKTASTTAKTTSSKVPEGPPMPKGTAPNTTQAATASKMPSAKAQKFLSLIAKGEGGYNSMNQGTIRGKIVGSTHDSTTKVGKNLTDMTVGEIMDMQKGSIKSGRKLFAVGKYQIIPDTMKEVVRTAGLKREDKFDEANQEKLGMALIQKRPDLHNYLTGKSNNENAALRAAAEEWASLPDPHTGRSVYGHGNKSSHSVASVREALIATRQDMMAPDAPTQFASSSPTPTSPSVSPGAPLPQLGTQPYLGSPTQPTQVAMGDQRSGLQKAKDFVLAGPSVAAKKATLTPAVSPSVSALKAPSGARTMLPGTSAPTHFPMTAQMSPDNTARATPAAQVAPVRGAFAPAPGPAPVQNNLLQVNQAAATAAAHVQAQKETQSNQKQRNDMSATSTVHHDSNMKSISMPANNPSMYRAFARAYGNETPGTYGESHFDYGK